MKPGGQAGQEAGGLRSQHKGDTGGLSFPFAGGVL